MTQNTDNTFQLDDPLHIEGKVTPERAAVIIDRMNKLMEEERKAASAAWQPKIYYR